MTGMVERCCGGRGLGGSAQRKGRVPRLGLAPPCLGDRPADITVSGASVASLANRAARVFEDTPLLTLAPPLNHAQSNVLLSKH